MDPLKNPTQLLKKASLNTFDGTLTDPSSVAWGEIEDTVHEESQEPCGDENRVAGVRHKGFIAAD